MDKKYQVFVSSTYADLREERQQVIQALLELDCIPSGMELFPAADEDQWSLIKNVIDECDYYVLIIGGRYGSIGPDGISYTEMEYRYALEIGKPIISFLHKDPNKISKENSELDPECQKLLDEFRGLAEQKMCKYWQTPYELGTVVSRSVINLQRRHPAIGWIRGDVISSEEASRELLKLNRQIEHLELQLNKNRTQAPPGTENLAQGNNLFNVEGWYTTSYGSSKIKFNTQITWNRIFFELSPLLIHEAPEKDLKNRFDNKIKQLVIDSIAENELYRFGTDSEYFDTAKIQLRALGLIRKSEKPRSVKDVQPYWTLTPYGDEIMNRFRAVVKR